MALNIFACMKGELVNQPKGTELGNEAKISLSHILKENALLSEQVDGGQLTKLITHITSAERIFVYGAGRTGFALKAAAMRLMHLGYTVHVVGETTTPAISIGDLLLVGSGSGTTSSIVGAAQKASKASASVVALTTAAESPLASYASVTVIIPAAQKEDYGDTVSGQYAGSLFEQAVWLLMDAVFHALWKSKDFSAQQLWKRHANLE